MPAKKRVTREKATRRSPHPPVYVGITTLNDEMCGWTVTAYGHSKKAVARKSREWLGPELDDNRPFHCSLQDVYEGNFRIVSLTVAQRKYKVRYLPPDAQVGKIVWRRKTRATSVS